MTDIDWGKYLRGVGKRHDLNESFFPELVDTHEPALLNTMPVLSAAAVGARLMLVLAQKGATRVKPSSVQKLVDVLAHALPDDVRNHCDDEVTRILDWFRYPPEVVDPEDEDPQIQVMHHGDIESRVATAMYALENDYDLEIEYYSVDRKVWPRVRATPLRIEDADDPEQSMLVIEHPNGTSQVAFMDVRWLMPVQRRKRPQTKPPARVLDFPGSKD